MLSIYFFVFNPFILFALFCYQKKFILIGVGVGIVVLIIIIVVASVVPRR